MILALKKLSKKTELPTVNTKQNHINFKTMNIFSRDSGGFKPYSIGVNTGLSFKF